MCLCDSLGQANLRAIQNVARKVLSYKALAYYSSASDEEIGEFIYKCVASVRSF